MDGPTPPTPAPVEPPARPGPEGGAAPPPRRRRRRWGRGFLLALFGVGLLLGAAGAALVKSRPGQRLVLDAALSRVQGALAGSLTVQGVRSTTLLGGATLTGVRLDAEGGRPFLSADSVRVRYSLLSLFGAPARIASLTLFGPRVEISRYPGEDSPNVARLLAPAREPTDTAAPGRARRGVSLGSVTVVDGLLEVLTPIEGEASARTPTVPSPAGEGTLRRLALDGLSLRLEDVLLGGPEGAALVASLTSLAMEAHVLDHPLVVTHAEGSVRFGPAGLEITEADFRFPASAFEGSLALGPAEAGGPDGADGPRGWEFRLRLATLGPADLRDLAWLDPRFPAGQMRGAITVEAGTGVEVGLVGVRVELEASRLALDGGIRLDGGLSFRDLEVQASPLDLAILGPWLEDPLPLEGWVSGSLGLSGSPASLRTTGRVTLVPTGLGGAPTTADVRGVLHLGGNPGVTGLTALLDPLNLELVRAFRPDLALTGRGRARVEASGRWASGVRFAVELEEGADGGGDGSRASRVLLQGSTRREGSGPWAVDVRAELAPLSLALVHEVVARVAPVGAVRGTVSAVGPLSGVEVAAELQGAGGSLSVEGLVDLESPAHPYALGARAEDLDFSAILPALPAPSRWSGRVEIEGEGLTPDSARARGTLLAHRSRVGGLRVDTLSAAFGLGGGELQVDTLDGRLGGFSASGSGAVGLVEGAHGELRLAFRTDDLVGLRPLLLGDTVVARDTLSVLEGQLLRLQGVDLDTLPVLADVAMSGSLDGDLVLSGTVAALGLRGGVRLRDVVVGKDSVGAADIHMDGRDLTGPGRRLDLALEAGRIAAFGRSFSGLEGFVSLDGLSGDASVQAVQATGERYDLGGTFALREGGGGQVRLERGRLELDSLAWSLARPAGIRWDSASVTLDAVELVRGGVEDPRLSAQGTLAWGGAPSDFRLEGRGVQLDLLARVAQWRGEIPRGTLDLTLEVAGDGASPVVAGWFRVAEPRYGDLSLTAVEGELRYRDGTAEVDLAGHRGERRVFRARGPVPVDLALRPSGSRVVDRSMDVRVEADALDASLLLSTLTVLEDVEGSVTGDFRIRGPLDRPEPSGVLELRDAAWSIEVLGVRHDRVGGTLTLNPDRTLDVAVDGRAAGRSTVRGKVHLEPVTDPRLDLTLGFDGFQAVNRRDMAGLMSGEVRLVGSYRAPRVEGALTVDQGTLFLEEFVRSIEIVDLTDPRIFQAVDTTVLASRPLLAGMRNPFLQNLRVDVDLSVPRDAWLRSEDMNVEIGGDLLVRYDRVSRDVVMVGELQALRGSYNVLGRRFDVQGGTVGFVGTPGINPTLDIEAVSRIRRVEGDPLDVTATVGGTLTQPRVELSSEDQGIAESDLVSYLIFGRPSYELATGQGAWLGGAAGSFVGAATGAGVNFLSGTLAARLGAALSQQIGVDYLSITQAGDFGVLSGSLAGSLAGTQVEVGQYLGERVFFVLIFRPIQGQNTSQSFFGGARVEVALTDDYNVQAFWEDRFLRSRVGGFGDLGLQASQVVGVFIFREWGY